MITPSPRDCSEADGKPVSSPVCYAGEVDPAYMGLSGTQLRAVTGKESEMANGFGTDFIIQVEDPKGAANFYVEQLGFEITGDTPNMVSIHGKNINFFIERGPPHGPVFEVFVGDVEAAKERLLKAGCTIVKDEPHVPRCYVRDPNGVMYNLAP